MSAEPITAALQAAQEYQPENPRPLMRSIPDALPYPAEALGTVLGDAAKAIQDKTQAPMAICAQSVLAAATVAVQGYRDIILHTGQQRPISSFFLTIAASGERKSTCDALALQPIRRFEEQLRNDHQHAFFAWETAHAVWEAQSKEITRNKKKNQEQKLAALRELGPEPQKPLIPLLTCPDPTFEGLCKLLEAGMPSVGIFADEAGQFIGGHGMKEENKIKTAAGLSSAWDGKDTSRVRSGDGTVILSGRRVSMHLMAQPNVAGIFLGDATLQDQGLHSRILVCFPKSTAGTRFWKEACPASEAAIRRYHDRLLHILERPLPLKEGKRNELSPPALTLSSKAHALLIRFADELEAQLGPGGELSPVAGLANKIPEHAARLAAVVAVIDDPDIMTVTEDVMVCGIELAQYHLNETLRLMEDWQTDPTLRLAQTLLDWLHQKWTDPLVSLPDIYQHGPNPIRDKRTAMAMVRILEEHGWLIPVPGGSTVNGSRRKEVWQIVKADDYGRV